MFQSEAKCGYSISMLGAAFKGDITDAAGDVRAWNWAQGRKVMTRAKRGTRTALKAQVSDTPLRSRILRILLPIYFRVE